MSPMEENKAIRVVGLGDKKRTTRCGQPSLDQLPHLEDTT